jgi:hypothetical protein
LTSIYGVGTVTCTNVEVVKTLLTPKTFVDVDKTNTVLVAPTAPAVIVVVRSGVGTITATYVVLTAVMVVVVGAAVATVPKVLVIVE